MAEALVNYFTLEHALFGTGTAIIISLLLRAKYSRVTIPVFIILLWELFEFRGQDFYWTHNIGNQVVDVFVGVLGVFLGNYLLEKYVLHFSK